jgi:hypothetical protein
MTDTDLMPLVPLIVMWCIFGTLGYGIAEANVTKLPQKIFLSLMGGPIIWLGWMVIWFCRWLFSK